MRHLCAVIATTLLAGSAFADTNVDNANSCSPILHMIPCPSAAPAAPCITPAERAAASVIIEQYRKKHPERTGTPEPGSLTFYPMAGRLYGDMFVNNYVDLDPTSGILDWDCTNHTYNGHGGIDTDLRSFSEQLIGVPAYAVLDGIVVFSHDGEFDMNTEPLNVPANRVIIDHGNDLYGHYWHFRNGSVSVVAGDQVVAGQQIAEVGSSGSSSAPHLHFELRSGIGIGVGNTYDPFAGSCHPVDSMWEDQQEFVREFYFSDHGITATPSSEWPETPYRFPNDRQFQLDDGNTYYWQIANNLPPTGTYTFRFYDPSGHLAHEWTDSWDIGQTVRRSYWIWNWTADFNPISSPGTWMVELDVVGETVLQMELEIVETIDENFNRAPAPIDIVMHPPAPEPDDVIECTVLGSLLHDDPDRDLVSYRYEWKVNGTTVRDVTTPAMRDVLRSDAAGTGDTVSVSVTPTDGELEGDSMSDEVQVDCEGDITGDGHVGVDDLLAVIAGWNNPYNVDDLLLVISEWGNTCP